MALFLDPAEILQTNDALNYINYENMNEEQREYLRTDLWDFEFTVPPAAVYFPGNALIKTRLTGVSPNFPGALGTITANFRGFDIAQKVGVHSNGSVTLNFIDREDQAITYFKLDWQQKLTNLDNRFTYRKEDTVAECKLTMFNSSRIPIFKWTLLTCQLDDGTLSRSFTSDDPAQNGETEMVLTYEHIRPLGLNLPE